MAEEDKTPLLTTDDDGFGASRKTVQSLCTQQLGLTEANGIGVRQGTINVSDCSFPRPTEPDSILAVFVVAFDTRSGNVVEWCQPDDLDIDGVEFKAMVSGSHTQTNDFVYFRKENMFGLACYEKMSIESEIERGARMKSVGILATSYTLLYRHMHFLEAQVKYQLENPGSYEQLSAFYEDKRAILSTSSSDVTIQVMNHSTHSTCSTPDILPEMKITHPAGCFTQFMQFFGVHIFTIWKYILLQKRILFFSPPPIGVVCYRVYCACCLGNHGMRGLITTEIRAHFYVNIADIDELESLHSASILSVMHGVYCACCLGNHGMRGLITTEIRPHFYVNIADIDELAAFSESIFTLLYCACCLGNHGMRGLITTEIRPHFYVNIADIDELESEVAYVACTTEKIFECKAHLYDVYVDNQNLKTRQSVLRDLLKVSDGDRLRYERLKRHRQDYINSNHAYGSTDVDDEDLFSSFFTELNDRILQTLLEVSSSQDRQLTSEHMRLMELDPISSGQNKQGSTAEMQRKNV